LTLLTLRWRDNRWIRRRVLRCVHQNAVGELALPGIIRVLSRWDAGAQSTRQTPRMKTSYLTPKTNSVLCPPKDGAAFQSRVVKDRRPYELHPRRRSVYINRGAPVSVQNTVVDPGSSFRLCLTMKLSRGGRGTKRRDRRRLERILGRHSSLGAGHLNLPEYTSFQS